MSSRSIKRRRLSEPDRNDHVDEDSDLEEISATVWNSMAQNRDLETHTSKISQRPISPPPIKYAVQGPPIIRPDDSLHASESPSIGAAGISSTANDNRRTSTPRVIPSPIQLSTVDLLPASHNVDTVTLRDILGDPLIKECWLFNYLFDVDFVMSLLDEDTRDLVQVKIIHGSWRKEDSNRIRIEESAEKYKNIQIITAYMPEMYGTHHSKMIILFRHDELAQVIILTGNFIPRDWSMCQAIWRSPLLPLLSTSHTNPQATATEPPPKIGSGARFKKDILAYLRAYGTKKTGPLTTELARYDFSTIRAALIGSVPGKQVLAEIDPDSETLWGWPALRSILSSIKSTTTTGMKPHIVMQCSSVASVGEKWMEDTFLPALSSISKQNMNTTSQSKRQQEEVKKPKFSLIFPTADEIRQSVDGYSSGSSIHMKTQTPAQLKQLAYLKPMLCHWAGDQIQDPDLTTKSSSVAMKIKTPSVGEALRRRAAPHIKIYIRFSNSNSQNPSTTSMSIDWAITTSANLSKQAWGEAPTAKGEVRICSYEIGVVVWPGLWTEDEDGNGKEVEMVPVFGRDTLDEEEDDDDGGEGEDCIMQGELEGQDGDDNDDDEETTDEEGGVGVREPEVQRQRNLRKMRVGLRMPYDLPLVPYGVDENPWCASTPCAEPDWMGRTWVGFGKS